MPVCAGVTGNGERCRRFVRGGTHCFMHAAAATPRAFFTTQDIEHVNSSNRRLKLVGLFALNKIRSDADAHALVSDGVLPRIIDLALDIDENENVRDRALWVLINLTSVPGDTGSLAITRIRPDFIASMAENILLDDPANVANYLWCLGNMAGSVPAQAIAMLDSEFHTTCVDILKDPRAEQTAHKYAAFLLSNLAPQTSQLVARELMTELEQIPPIVLTNISLLVDLFWAINRLYLICRHIEIQTAILLVNSLDLIANKAVKPAIETIADICSGTDSDIIVIMIVSGLLEKLHKLIFKPMFSPLAFLSISNIACELRSIPRILNTPGLLLDIFTFVSRSRDAIWTITNLATRGDRTSALALLRYGLGSVLLPLFERADDILKVIILEALISVLKQARAIAYVQFMTHGMGRLPETHTNPQINALLLELRNESARFSAAEPPQPPAAIAEILEAAPLSLAANLAAARVTEALARAGHQIVDISDLVFTGADVAHLIGLGFRFRADGTMGGALGGP